MPIFLNLSASADTDEAHELSAKAGAEVTLALEKVMRSMRAYETQQGSTLAQDLSEASKHFHSAGVLFRQLEKQADDSTIAIPPNLLPAWKAATDFSTAMTPTLTQPLGTPPTPGKVSVRQFMHFAAQMTTELESSINATAADVNDPAGGRRIAIRASVLQMFGTLISQVLSEIPRPQPLVRYA